MLVKNKVALITGGASGFGSCFAEELLKSGLKGVTIADIDVNRGTQLISSFEEQFGPKTAIFVKVDVTNEFEFAEAFEKTLETFGSIDIVINSAGIFNERNFKQVININLNGVATGTLLGFEKYLPKYKSSEEAVVVNISSIYGLDGCQCGLAYTAANHGVVGLGKCLSTKRHFQETGVKILTLCPGHSSTALCLDIQKKILPHTKYQNMMLKLWSNLYHQSAEFVAKCLKRILEDFESGEVWLIENDECHQIEIPSRVSLKRVKTLYF